MVRFMRRVNRWIHPLSLFFLLCGIAAAGINIGYLLSPRFADAFNAGPSSHIRMFMARLTGWLPFSLAEFIVLGSPVIAAVIIVIAVLKEKDKDDKKTQPSPERWEQLREERVALHEAERQEKEEEASQYDFDWDLDYDFSNIDDMDAFINAITGGQIQGMSQYMSPDMQDALEEYLEVFQMLDDLDMSNLDQYVDQINQISYDLSGIDISGIYSGDPDAAYEEIMQQMEELFGDDADLDWDFDEDIDVSWDVEGDETVITSDDEGEAEN